MFDFEYQDMAIRLWESDKVSDDDKKWLDKLSTKKNFRCSEKKRIQELCVQTFGQLPKF